MNLVPTGSYKPAHHPFNYPIQADWQPFFDQLQEKQWFHILLEQVEQAYADLVISPKEKFLWRAFELTSLKDLKGIILGQDPYPSIEHANGLAFSVREGLTIPPSLRSIFFELERTHHIETSKHGDLSSWAKQGILLLNNSLVLDMATKKPPQHIPTESWTKLTQSIINHILEEKAPSPLFMLAMGKKAQKSAKAFLLANHLHIIKTPHPSPLAAIGLKAQPFIGCGCFTAIDAFLKQHQLPAITWALGATSDAHKDNHPHES